MGKLIPLSFKPGSMFTDIVQTDLGPFQYQEVRNLRIVREGEWDNPDGYINIKTGFMDLRAGEEFTEDASGNRFLLLQDGTALKRIDYDAGDGNGYENEAIVTVTLPSGVTIGATAVLRFHYHNGI